MKNKNKEVRDINYSHPHPKYSRQILLSQIGKEGQEKLSRAKVAIVGIGALGTVAVELLARAGIGSLLLIDRDIIEESNLQRQFLFDEKDIGKSKSATAQEKLQRINSQITIVVETIHLNAKNINLLQKYDLILDCTDNLTTRFLLNDYCKKEKKKWIYAAAIKTSGYVLPIFPEGPCLRCFLREAHLETCDTVGVLNTNTAVIASLQTTLALKIILEIGVQSKLLHFDTWNQTLQTMDIKKNKNCPTCNGKYTSLAPKEETRIVRFCSQGKYQVFGNSVDLKEIENRWKKIEKGKTKLTKTENSIQINNIILFKDGRALIAAKSEAEALSIYSKWIGN